MPPSEKAARDAATLRPFRPGLAFSFFNAITWQIALGTPMVLYAEALGASTFVVGTVYAFVFLLTPIQALATSLLPRFGFKRLMLFCWMARSLFLLPLVWLAWERPSSGSVWAIALFVFSVFAFCFFRAVGSCGYVPWLYSLIPDSLRGRYFGSAQIWMGLSSVSTLLFCSILFSEFAVYLALFWQYIVAFAGSLLSFASLAALPDGKRPKANSLAQTLAVARRYLLRPGPYRHILSVHIVLATCASSLPPFAAYYLKAEVGLSESRILALATLQSLGVILSAFFVRRTLDIAGPRSIFLLGVLLYAVLATLWLAETGGLGGGFGLYVTLYVLVGVAACFWFTAHLNYLPYVIEENDRPLMVAVNSSLVSLVSGVAPVLWGLALKETGPQGGTAVDATWFRVYFVCLMLVAVALVPALMRIRLRKFDRGREIRVTTEALRPFRAITAFAAAHPEGRYEEGSGPRPEARPPRKEGP